MLPRFKAAAVHAAPVFLDKQATTKKAISLIREAAAAGAEIVAFSETFIPAFPVWAALWAPIDNHDLFVRMADQSVPVDGPEVKGLNAHVRQDLPVLTLPGPVTATGVPHHALAQERPRSPGVRAGICVGEQRGHHYLAATGLGFHQRSAGQHGIVEVRGKDQPGRIPGHGPFDPVKELHVKPLPRMRSGSGLPPRPCTPQPAVRPTRPSHTQRRTGVPLLPPRQAPAPCI